jgi:nitrogen fixation-related uncharacterized protein
MQEVIMVLVMLALLIGSVVGHTQLWAISRPWSG